MALDGHGRTVFVVSKDGFGADVSPFVPYEEPPPGEDYESFR